MHNDYFKFKRNLFNEFYVLEQNVLPTFVFNKDNKGHNSYLSAFLDKNQDTKRDISKEKPDLQQGCDVNKLVKDPKMNTIVSLNNVLKTQLFTSPVIKNNNYKNDVNRLLTTVNCIDSSDAVRDSVQKTARLMNSIFDIPSDEIMHIYKEIYRELVPVLFWIIGGSVGLGILNDNYDEFKKDIIKVLASIISFIGVIGILMYSIVWSQKHVEFVNKMFLNQQTKEFIIWFKRKLIIRRKFFDNPIVIMGSIGLSMLFYFLGRILKGDLINFLAIVFGYAKNIIKTIYTVIQSLLKYISAKADSENVLLFGSKSFGDLFFRAVMGSNKDKYHNMTWGEFIKHQEENIGHGFFEPVNTEENIDTVEKILGWSSVAVIIVFLVVMVNLVVKGVSYSILLDKMRHVK